MNPRLYEIDKSVFPPVCESRFGKYYKWLMALKSSGGSSPETPVITSLSDSSFYAGQSIVINGTGFKPSGATVELNTQVDGEGTAVGQTVTSQTSTAIYITVNRGALSLGTVYLIVYNTDGNQNSGYSCTLVDVPAEGTLPIGMNLTETNYWQPGIIFTDIMKTASTLAFLNSSNTILYESSTPSPEISIDSNGYPTVLPQTIAAGTIAKYSFGINNYYPAGTYNIFYDGVGSFAARFGCTVNYSNGQYSVTITGNGVNSAINVTSSQAGNYVRNIRIIPQTYGTGAYPTFLPAYLQGLAPFHCIRFMSWFGTNNSKQVHWSDRSTSTYYSQSTSKAIAFEYAIELCNTLNADAWVCVPHMASDDYITQMATLFKNTLNPNLKIYLEYSNEIWNWAFYQTHWIVDNGRYTGSYITWSGGEHPVVDAYVATDLAAIAPAGEGYPWKDAYMMARTFRLWADVFGAEMSTRVVRVATSQAAWVAQTGQVLNYIFNTLGSSCDAISVGGYFYYNHNDWVAIGEGITYDDMYNTTLAYFNTNIKPWIEGTAALANQYGIDYLVYEGGQHMVLYNQDETLFYKQKLYDFQIQPQMYDLYAANFNEHTLPTVNCKLFMAFEYISARQKKYGSWGHLEGLDQIGTDYYVTAPKYKALLDYNTIK